MPLSVILAVSSSPRPLGSHYDQYILMSCYSICNRNEFCVILEFVSQSYITLYRQGKYLPLIIFLHIQFLVPHSTYYDFLIPVTWYGFISGKITMQSSTKTTLLQNHRSSTYVHSTHCLHRTFRLNTGSIITMPYKHLYFTPDHLEVTTLICTGYVYDLIYLLGSKCIFLFLSQV